MMKNIPERIYLQVGFEPDADTDFNKISADGSVSWCADRINESDIEYAHAAELDRLKAQRARILEALKEFNRRIRK